MLSAFKDFISPLDTEVFYREYWEQKEAFIGSSDNARFQHYFKPTDFESVLTNRTLQWGQIQLANHNPAESWENLTNLPISYSTLKKAINQGDSIIINNLQSFWVPLARLCRSLERIFDFTVNANLYVTPPKSQGLSPHFDEQDVFVMQIAGEKTWNIYNNDYQLPLDINLEWLQQDHNHIKSRYALKPGDLLYIPRGVPHDAFSHDSTSIHITLAVSTVRWLGLINELLITAAENDIDLRKGIPIGFLNKDPNLLIHTLRERLERSLANMSVERVFERYADKLISRMYLFPRTSNLFSDDCAKPINLSSRVQQSETAYFFVQRSENSVTLKYPEGALTGPFEIEEAFQFISNNRDYCIGELPDSVDDETKVIIIERLVAENVLEIL